MLSCAFEILKEKKNIDFVDFNFVKVFIKRNFLKGNKIMSCFNGIKTLLSMYIYSIETLTFYKHCIPARNTIYVLLQNFSYFYVIHPKFFPSHLMFFQPKNLSVLNFINNTFIERHKSFK